MKLLIIILFTIISLQASAQVNLSSFANRNEVRRISGVASTIKRPLLSLNTMYSGANYQKGYDLEFVLNSLALHAGTLNSIFTDAIEPIIINPTSTNDIDQNARVLQHKAFRTLLTYVRSRNNQPAANIPGTTIPLAFSENDRLNFINALKNPASHFLVSENNSSGITNDYVKWAQSLANYARAIDLYLAFEIAVDVYDHNNADQYLLSMAEKETVFS
jgi:hypothetical protein